MQYKMDVRMTFGKGGWDEAFSQTVMFIDGGEEENRVLNLYPEITDGSFEGFGGAVTESAAYVYSLMPDQDKRRMLETYFSPGKMNYQFLRVSIDSCDFSLEQYEAMSDPKDRELNSFSLKRDKKWIIPMLRDIEKIAGRKVPIMLTPWSPPAFMKTNGRRELGGKLKEEYYDLWAEYLCRYIIEYRKQGFHVARLSLQNEPKAVQSWDSCIFTSQDEKLFLKNYLYPALEKYHLTDIEVFIWDHNKERVYERMRDVLDEETDHMVAGAAVHWYSGDHFELLDLCGKLFPEKKLIVSESCIEFYKYDVNDSTGAAMALAHEIIGDLNHGVTAFYDWNLLLNESGGPNYVHNYCLAPFLFNTKEKRLYPQLLQQYIEHFSHYLTKGSARIAHSCYSPLIEMTAWKRPDDTIALIVLNKNVQPCPVTIRMQDKEAGILLYPQSVMSAVIDRV